MTAGLSLGLDFGTTNTVVALADDEGVAHLVRFPAPEGELFAFRSALSFHAPPGRRASAPLRPVPGRSRPTRKIRARPG